MLKGKTAVITGSTSGIGLGIAHALAAEGANVVLNGFGDAAEIEKTRAAIEKEFGQKVAFRMLLEELSTFQALSAHLQPVAETNPAAAAPIPGRSSNPRESAPAARFQPITQATVNNQPSPIRRRLSSERAKELLARVDQLSDSEVEALLQDPELKELLP